ncbi:MAG: acetyl-CoA carboxylase, biotin carboxyl carrier protein [Flammeovirgaceae bacterium]|nr:acetyl-CoA carboxylase, biotin carboxyl carrier protein [Flammeovirgaceae bacterium]|tara:strand:- start:3438 stop:3893 length:456 start_codon:yes stop_codon:yes gene_type:complete
MKIKEIQDIINFIKKSDLDDVSIETENYKIRVKKNNGNYTTTELPKEVKVSTPQSQQEVKKVDEKKESTSSNNLIIKSPMIGTFYRSPNPESDPFVSEGDTIKVGQTICIVEAMKLFNDIESEVSGKVVKILVDDNSPIEFDQPLFEVEPS